MVFFARKLLGRSPSFCIYIDNNVSLGRIMSEKSLPHVEENNGRKVTAAALSKHLRL
jgi:hypothetical protein